MLLMYNDLIVINNNKRITKRYNFKTTYGFRKLRRIH